MDCRRADELLIDFLYRALDERTREEFERHLESCPAHRLEVEQHGRLLRALRAEPREEPAPELDGKVLAEARRALSRPAGDERPWWAMVFRPSFAAAAVVLLVGVALVVFYQRFSEPLAPADAARPAGPPPPPAVAQREKAPEAASGPEQPKVDRGLAESAVAPGGKESSLSGDAKPEGGLAPRVGVTAAAKLDATAAKPAERRAPPALERSQAPRKGAGAPRTPTKGEEGGATLDLAAGTGARSAAGGVAQARPDVPPSERVGEDDDSAGRRADRGAAEEQEYRFAQPPPAAADAAAPVKKTEAASVKTAGEERKAAVAAPASEPKSPRSAEAAPMPEETARDEEDRAERARAKSAKDKASDEIEPLRRCVREQSGARAVECRYRLFDALFRAGRCADAVSAAEQAVSAAPADPRAADTLLDAASCLENLGRLDRARVFYQRVEKDYPAHAAEARRALQRLP